MRTEPSPLDCQALRASLDDYLDDRLEPRDLVRINAHLRHCEPCTTALTALLATVQALHALPAPVPTTDPWAAIAFALRREGLIVPWYRKRSAWRAGAAMAGAVLVVWVYQASRPTTQMANLDAYWREHAIYSSQTEPAPGAPAIDAMEATYQLQGGTR